MLAQGVKFGAAVMIISAALFIVALLSPTIQSSLVCLHHFNWPPVDLRSPQVAQRLPWPLGVLDSRAAKFLRDTGLLSDAARSFDGIEGAEPFAVESSAGRGALRGWVVAGAGNCSAPPAAASAPFGSGECPVVLYLHGNAGNRAVAHRVRLYRTLGQRLGARSVVALDYAGFGDSGSCQPRVFPNEASLTEDALDTWRWMTRRWRHTRPIVWGHSLGSGVATGLAHALRRSEHAHALPSAIVLEAPFNSVPGVVLSYIGPIVIPWLEAVVWSHLSTVRFDSESRIGAISGGTGNDSSKNDGIPTLILSARHDSVVPAKLARRLYDKAREGSAAGGSLGRAKLLSYHSLANAGHDTIMDEEEAIAVVRDFFRKVAAFLQ